MQRSTRSLKQNPAARSCLSCEELRAVRPLPVALNHPVLAWPLRQVREGTRLPGRARHGLTASAL